MFEQSPIERVLPEAIDLDIGPSDRRLDIREGDKNSRFVKGENGEPDKLVYNSPTCPDNYYLINTD